jgi:hypothetical protein
MATTERAKGSQTYESVLKAGGKKYGIVWTYLTFG